LQLVQVLQLQVRNGGGFSHHSRETILKSMGNHPENPLRFWEITYSCGDIFTTTCMFV